MGGEILRNYAIDDVVFHPDGSQILVCAGRIIMMYNATNGYHMRTLDGHEDQIQSLCYSFDGCYFASGGADRFVLVWTSMGKIVQRYSHDDSVRKVLFNPVNVSLASYSNMDIGIWSLDTQDVAKFKTSSQVLSINWSKDGEILALGMMSGQLSLRNKKGSEILLVCCDGIGVCRNVIEKKKDIGGGHGEKMITEERSGGYRCDVVGHAPLLLEESYKVSHSTSSHVIAGDYEALLHLSMSKQEFEKASDIFKKHAEDIPEDCKVHYANWLLSYGSHEEALHVFRLCLETEKYLDVVEKMASCSVKLGTYFNDVSYFFWLLGRDLGKRVLEGREDSRSESYIQASHLYYAYHMIHEYCDNPFTLTEPEVLLRASVFLLNSLGEIPSPAGISRAKILYSLLQQGLVLQLYDVARYAYSQLQTIKCPQIWDSSIELSYMMLQTAETKTEFDKMHVVCYNCGASNPLLNLSDDSLSKGDRCVKCYHAFKRCFLTFTILPLVEVNPGNINGKDEQFSLEVPGDEQVTENSKPVNKSFPRHCDGGATFTVCTPKRMHFRNVNPGICVTMGPSDEYGCFFLSNEWELEVLKSGRCPFSRVQVNLHYP